LFSLVLVVPGDESPLVAGRHAAISPPVVSATELAVVDSRRAGDGDYLNLSGCGVLLASPPDVDAAAAAAELRRTQGTPFFAEARDRVIMMWRKRECPLFTTTKSHCHAAARRRASPRRGI